MKITVKAVPSTYVGVAHTHDFSKYQVWFTDLDTLKLLVKLQEVVNHA